MKGLGRDTTSYPISSLANKQGEKGGGQGRGGREGEERKKKNGWGGGGGATLIVLLLANKERRLLNYNLILSLQTGAAPQLSLCMEPHGLPAARRVHRLHIPLQLHGDWNQSECHAHPDGERGRLEAFQHISPFKLDHV